MSLIDQDLSNISLFQISILPQVKITFSTFIAYLPPIPAEISNPGSEKKGDMLLPDLDL